MDSLLPLRSATSSGIRSSLLFSVGDASKKWNYLLLITYGKSNDLDRYIR